MASIGAVINAIEMECNTICRTTSFKAISKAHIAGVIMRNVAEDDVLNRAGTGKVYRRHGNTHRASSAGNPPAPDTGTLRKSNKQDVKYTKIANGVSIHLGMKNVAKYAGYLEYGTRHMEARPFMDEIAEKSRPKIESLYAIL